MFEKASKLKLRYKVTNGLITTEDLWDLNLVALDKVAKGLNKEIKESSEESFISVKSASNNIMDLKFDIVKHVISVKMNELEARTLSVEKAQKRAHLEELIAKKEVSVLEGKSIEELRAELANV